MKKLIIVLLFIAPFAQSAEVSDCVKLASFKESQQRQLNLSKYGLGLTDAEGYEKLNADATAKYLEAVANCKKDAEND